MLSDVLPELQRQSPQPPSPRGAGGVPGRRASGTVVTRHCNSLVSSKSDSVVRTNNFGIRTVAISLLQLVGFTVLKQHLDNFLKISIKFIETLPLRMRSGHAWHEPGIETGAGIPFDNRSK